MRHSVDTFAVFVTALAGVILSSVYFRRYRLTRRPLGVISAGDLGYLSALMVMMPFAYLALPRHVTAAVFISLDTAFIARLAAPVIGRRLATVGAASIVGADLFLALTVGGRHPAFCAVNNAVILLSVCGVANLWATAGFKARHFAVYALLLGVYDGLTIFVFHVTKSLLYALQGNPLFPTIAWGHSGIGYGDLLYCSVWTLIAHKAYGTMAGRYALLGTALGLAAGWIVASVTGQVLPAMVVLAPIIACQYAWWWWRHGPERTTREFMRELAAIRPTRRTQLSRPLAPVLSRP